MIFEGEFMRRRKPGSGFANRNTKLIEELFAAILEDDRSGVKVIRREIDREYEIDRSGLTGEAVTKALSSIANDLGMSFNQVIPHPEDQGGDVKAASSGVSHWFELKAQTKKANFSDITQADYVRDGTDFLRRYLLDESKALKYITAKTSSELGLGAGVDVDDRWSIHDLHAADLCLLPSKDLRLNVGVKKPSDLLDFASRKYLLQLTQEGARLIKLSDMGPIRDILDRKFPSLRLKTSNRNELSIQMVYEGGVDFTYHIGYANAPGRHKLHSRALSRSVVTAEYLF
jgi:hypothetical protein